MQNQRILLVVTIILTVVVFGRRARVHGALSSIINNHNYGYKLTKDREITLATYYAKMVFHIPVPAPPSATVRVDLYNCSTISSFGPGTDCDHVQGIFNLMHEIRRQVQNHIRHSLLEIQRMVHDMPRSTDRTRRGIMANMLSWITGLATQEQVHSVRQILRRVESGIHAATELWGSGSKSITASMKVQQNRMDNVFEILKQYWTSLRAIQLQILQHTRADQLGASALQNEGRGAKFRLSHSLYHWLLTLRIALPRIYA